MNVSASGAPAAPDPAAVRAAAPETDAIMAASRAVTRTRTVTRVVPGASEGFGIALASAVGAKWPPREEFARRGDSTTRSPHPASSAEAAHERHLDDGHAGGGGRASITEPSGDGAHATLSSSPLGRAALRTLAHDMFARETTASASAADAATADAAEPAPAAAADGAGAGAVALPAEFDWKLAPVIVAKPADAADDVTPATPETAPLLLGAAAPALPSVSGSTAALSTAPSTTLATTATAGPIAAPPRPDRATVQFGGDDGPAGTVRLSLRGDRVHATIIAPTAADAEALAHGLDGLRRSLHAQGFGGAHVTVQAPRGAQSPAAPHQPLAHNAPDDNATSRDPRRSRDEAAARRALRSLSSPESPDQQEDPR